MALFDFLTEKLRQSKNEIASVSKASPPLEVYRLEPRIMLNAAAMDAGEAVEAQADAELSAPGEYKNESLPVEEPLLPQDLVDYFDVSQHDESVDELHDPLDGFVREVGQKLKLVFIDAGVEGSDALVANLRAQEGEDRAWLIVQIDTEEDGLSVVSETLRRIVDVDAVHIVSHGNDQGFQLGTTWVDAAELERRAGEVASWAGSLDADADVLIYGCDLASSEAGRMVIEGLGLLCDCDVAASDDLTGHEELGGDWDLEFHVGQI